MPAPDPAPGPENLSSFADLTARLRELFAWCGQPKYRSLSQASGLAPSAISSLIGKRPSGRPPQATTLRFVEACLHRGGLAEHEVESQVAGWSAAWERLDADEARADPFRPGVQTPDPGPTPSPTRARRRGPSRAVLVGMGVVVAVLVVAGATLGLTRRDSASAGGAGGETGSPRSVCQRTDISEANDVRNARTWDTAFRCPNEVGAEVRLQPDPGSPLVSRMKTPTSWFVCWTRGKEHAGGNAIWYYTQGDAKGPGRYQVDHSWGYVAANDLGTEHDPDPKAFRRCPANTPAL